MYMCHSDVVCDEICVIHDEYVWTVYVLVWVLTFELWVILCFIQICCIQSDRG